MNVYFCSTTATAGTSSGLARLIAKARSCARQAAETDDVEERRDLVEQFLELNERICREPVAALEDVRAKARHLLWALTEGGDPLDCDAFEALLRSLTGEVVS